MYVCVCNAYPESQVREAIRTSPNGFTTVEEVCARLGKRPRCGRCLTHVRDLIADATRKAPIEDVSSYRESLVT